MKKRVRCVLSVIFAAVCAFPAVPVWGYAAGDIQSRCYSVGMDYILGIEPGTVVETFFENIENAGPNACVFESDGKTMRSGCIQEGDILAVHGQKYTLETTEPLDKIIIYDDFEDGKIGGWTWGDNVSKAMISIERDPTHGNILAWTAAGASAEAPKAFDTRRNVSVTGAPDILIHEIDFKYPMIAEQNVSLIARNSADKYLTTTRLVGRSNLYALDPSGLRLLMEGVKADAWYHARYIMDMKNGSMDMYIDGQSVAEDMAFQATTNSPGNYLPTMLCAGAGGIKQNGTILAIDNVSLYAPQPVKVKKVSITANGQESYDLADIPADVEAITIYFSAQQGFVPAADGIDQAIGLYTQDGKQIPAAGQYDEEQMAYTIRPKTLLESGIVYQIGIDGVTDNIYHTRYERTLQIKTNETPVPFVLSEVTAEKDGTVYTDLLKLPADTEKISLYFITQPGCGIDAADIESYIRIVDAAGQTIAAIGDLTDHVYTLTLLQSLECNAEYTLEIDELPDDTYGIPYTKSISVQAVANWVVEAGDIIYSDLYTVTDGLIQGIKCGTTAAELWLNLHTLPGTQARIYTDDTKSRQRTGIIQTGDILTADNALLGYHKTYTLKTKGMALNSAIYNIGSGFIMGIAEDTEIDAFMANMNIVGSGTWQIRGNDGRNKETGKIETGDVLTLTAGSLTEEYVLETTTPKDRVYFYDDFENGSKGSWNNGDIVRDSDGKYGQSIAWSTIDASRENPASISAARTFSTEGKPQILVYETEFKMPIYANVTVSNYLRNAKNEALATIRIDDRNQLGALVPGGASVLLENLQNKWYHAKYVCDNIDGKMNAYVDGKLVGEGLQFQAKEDYFPDKITVGASNIQTAGTLFMLDNVTVYEPNPIKVGKLTIMQDNVSSTDLRNIPVNTDAIQIQFTKQAGFDIDTDHAADKVKLLDENGRTVSSVGTLDAKTGIYTLQINEILTPKRGYQIVVEKIQDTVYHKNYSIAVPVTTGMEPAYIKKPSIIDVEGNMAEKIQNEKVTVVIPIVNLGEDAELTTILACYDETGRIVAVFKKTADAEKRGLTEVSLSCDLTSKNILGGSVKIFVKGNGPLSTPFTLQ